MLKGNERKRRVLWMHRIEGRIVGAIQRQWLMWWTKMTVEKFSLFGINLTFMSFHIVSIAERWASSGAKWPLRCSLRLVCFPQLSFKLVQNRFLVLCPSPYNGNCLLKMNRIIWSDTVVAIGVFECARHHDYRHSPNFLRAYICRLKTMHWTYTSLCLPSLVGILSEKNSIE